MFDGDTFDTNPNMIHRAHYMILPPKPAWTRQKRVLPPVKCAPSNSSGVTPAMAAVAVRIMDRDPTSGQWGCPGRRGWREHRQGDQPPPPPQPAPESITICWSDKFSQAECRLLLLWRPRKFFGGKKEKNEKTSPSWGGQGGGLPLLEPGQLGPALNNNLCCKIEEIIYETRVQYSKRNLPQTPHDEAWKEGM